MKWFKKILTTAKAYALCPMPCAFRKRICLMPYVLCLIVLPSATQAFTYNHDNISLRFSGHGMGGAALPESAIYDYRIRGQAGYALRNGWTIGAVYSMDYLAYEFDRFYSDAFIFTESPHGRAEIGWTESVSVKLGLGLPDVGAMRVNNNPIIYKITDTTGVISNPATTGTAYSFRATAVTVPTRPFQLGASFSPYDENFNNSAEFGIRYRYPHGKVKFALAAGAGFTDAPRELYADLYTPRVTADSRSQGALAANIQYLGWQFGATLRGIYDRGAIGAPSDGMQTGVGASYDFLNWSASGTYILSAIGIWDNNPDFQYSVITHTGVFSLRYKIDQHFDIFASTGTVAQSSSIQPFVAAGLRGRF